MNKPIYRCRYHDLHIFFTEHQLTAHEEVCEARLKRATTHIFQVEKESEEKPQVFERYDVIRKRWVDVPVETDAESENKKTQVGAVAKPKLPKKRGRPRKTESEKENAKKHEPKRRKTGAVKAPE